MAKPELIKEVYFLACLQSLVFCYYLNLFFMQVGGIELIFGFMVMYIQSMRTLLEIKRQSFKRIINTIYASLLSTTAFKPRTFYLQSTFCVIAFVVTGSISLSMVFFMPGMLLNNLSV